MDDIVRCLETKCECRTPIVVMTEHCGGRLELVPDAIRKVAARCDCYVEHVHCKSNDDLTAIGKRIDTAIINGDWLLLTFGCDFDTSEFLRVIGRRLFTIMPDAEKRPNMELFRLWLCLDRTIQQPLVFQHVSLAIDLSVLFTPTAKPPELKSSADLRGIAAQYEEEIPVDESEGCDALDSVSVVSSSRPGTASMVAAKPGLSSRPPSGLDSSAATKQSDEQECDPLTSTKVGPLFHRRLELSSGRRPVSSGSRAAEIRQLRVQSAQLQRQAAPAAATARPPSTLRPVTADGLNDRMSMPQRMSASARPSTAHVTSDVQDRFERASSETLQKVHGSLIKAFTYSQPAAQRMLQFLLDFAENSSSKTAQEALSEAAAMTASDHLAIKAVLPGNSSLEALAGAVPRHSSKGLYLADVLLNEDGIVIRQAKWRGVDVLVEQMNVEQYATAFSGLTRVRCTLRHPSLHSPMAVLQDDNSAVCYIVGEFPSKGPLQQVLRRLPPPSGNDFVPFVLSVARTVALGLQFMHDEGYVHRDVSCHNILDFDNNKFQLRITNKYRRIEADGAVPTEGVATRWACPDALFTGRYHPEDDVWSLGVLLWELLTLCKEVPFAQYPLKEEVAAALARGEQLQCPDAFKKQKVWTQVAAPCFLTRMRRPTLDKLIAVIDSLLPIPGV